MKWSISIIRKLTFPSLFASKASLAQVLNLRRLGSVVRMSVSRWLVSSFSLRMNPTDGYKRQALRAAGIFSVLFILAFALMVIPKGGILRGEDGSILNGPFIAGLVPILIFYFVLVGVVYGVVAGTLKLSLIHI